MKKFKLLSLLGICLITIAFSGLSQGSGRAYDFNSSYLNVPNSTSLNSTVITLEAWIKADSWATNIWENVIISKDGWATGDQGYCLRAGANGALSFLIGDGTWHEATSTALMGVGKWYHVAGTYDGTTMRAFINGVQVGSLTYTGAISTTSYNLAIGKMTYSAGGTRYFDGMIDEVRIWNSALPESSLKQYMCKKMDITHPQFSNLVAHYNLDATGAIVDQSSFANNGTSVGAVQVNSGAPIGDESIFVYSSGAINLTLANGIIDSINVNSTSGLSGVHLYRVNGLPLGNALASAIDSVDQSQYYGVFPTNTGTPSYNLTYYYAGNPFYNSGTQPYGVLASRASGNATNWASAGATNNIAPSTFTKAMTARLEMRLAHDCPFIFVNALSNLSFCSGGSVTISDVGPSSVHQWYNAAGPLTGETGSTFTTGITGSYYVIVNSGACAITSSTFNVVANMNPIAVFGSIDPTYCINDPAHNIIGGTPSFGIYSGIGISGNTFNPTTAGIGTFNLVYSVVDNNSCTDTDTVSVSVVAAPNVPLVTQTGADLCTAQTTGITYQWYLNGTAIAGATGNCHTALTNGNYTVYAMNSEGCEKSSVVYNLNDLGIENGELSNFFSVSPNPATDILTIQSENETFTFKLLDAKGRLVHESNFSAMEHKVTVNSLDKGIYLLQVTSQSGTTVKKIQVI